MHLPFILNRCVLVRTVFQLCVFKVQVYDTQYDTAHCQPYLAKTDLQLDRIESGLVLVAHHHVDWQTDMSMALS